MQTITLNNVLPAVFAGREPVPSQVWQCQLTLERGKSYLIVAESGTGKSSMCSYLYGYRRDYSGAIAFDDADIRSLTMPQWCTVRRTAIAYLPQEMRLFAELTALDNVMLKNRLTQHKSAADVEAMFHTLGIADKMHTPVARLSIGQQQRVAIIRTLCQRADVFLLDEPVSHLDASNNAIVAEMFASEAKQQGAAIVATSVGNHLALDYNVQLSM